MCGLCKISMRNSLKVKACSICKNTFPQTTQYFSTKGKGKLDFRCRPCQSKRQLSYRKNNPAYESNRAARERCTNVNHKNYSEYGGRGIQFKFATYAEFLLLLGPRPVNMSLDRIDTNGHYEPNNVKWSTHEEQMRNTRANVLNLDEIPKIKDLHKGGLSYSEIGILFGVNPRRISNVCRGLSWYE